MTQIHTHAHRGTEAAAARRLLGLDATASPAEVDAAVSAARAAIRVPEDAPDLVPTAAHLHRRLDRARTVLLSTLHPVSVQPSAPLPPTPPPPPVEPRPPGSHVAGGYEGASFPITHQGMHEPVRPGRAARARGARQKRSEHTRASVHAVGLVLALLILGAAAFALTRALSRSGPTAHGSASTTTTSTAPPTTVPAPTFSERLIAGELGRSPRGLAAASAQDALQAWIAAFQAQDGGPVAQGLDDQARLMDLAEIGSRSTPQDLDKVTCAPFGSGIWRCKVGAVTSATKRVEVAKTSAGWRVRGWIG